MNRSLLILMMALCQSGCVQRNHDNLSAAPPAHDSSAFFVATNGNDHWSGRLPSPNERRIDGPFASLPRALKAVRDLKVQIAADVRDNSKKLLPRSAFVIRLRQGIYFLPEPIILRSQDSDLVIVAFPGEWPVLSGGRRLQGWKPVTVAGKSLWAADIPEVREGKWVFRELWINGRRAVRARHPKRGYLAVDALPDKAPEWTQGTSRFRFREGDLKAWPSVTNAELVVMSRWVESRLPIISLDEKERLVSFSKRSVFELAPGDPYYLEGAFELLEQPGEWYLDQAAGTLFYLARPGERLDQIEAIAPVLPQLIRIEGRPEAAEFVKRVVFRGLSFAHTKWYFPKGFHDAKSKPNIWPEPKPDIGGFAQAAIGVPGAVWGEGARACVFTNCTFSHLGNYGLELGRGCQGNRIVRCEFFDLGAGGVKLGETVIRDQPQEQARANEISDCRIHEGGKMFHSAIGIWIGQSPDNRVAYNLIHDFYYTGISIGWTWGYGPALATNNTVEFNHVHHIGVTSDADGPILSDMGGIYTLGRQPGTTIRNNLWHDIAGLRYGGWGIYFDEGSSGIVAESNVVYRTTHGGFHQHYGETNVVRNNIFAFARDHQIQRTRPESHSSFHFQTNIVYFDSGALLGGDWSGDNYEMDWNLYFDARPTPADALRFGGDTLGKWRERGHDRHSVLADPLFLAPQQSDFRLRANSPALKIGFQPIDLSAVGPIN